MSFIQNSFDGRDLSLIEAQKQFKKEFDLKVEEITSELPEMLRPIIMRAAEQLEADLPDELRKPDPVTHDVLNASGIYMRLLFSVSNALGHGASWLR